MVRAFPQSRLAIEIDAMRFQRAERLAGDRAPFVIVSGDVVPIGEAEGDQVAVVLEYVLVAMLVEDLMVPSRSPLILAAVAETAAVLMVALVEESLS